MEGPPLPLLLLPGLLLLSVTPTGSMSGPPILHCREDAGPADFSFSLPTWTKPTPLVIVHPDGRAVMTRYGHFRPMREGEFYERLSNVETRQDRISFTLNGVSASDAGDYICRDGLITGRIVGNCGQDLHFIDGKKPHVRESGLAVRNQTFHLNCEVYVPDEAPRLGLNFSFLWFKDGQPIPDRHGRVLTFPSVQLSDQGEYTCQVSEETRGCGSSPKSSPFSLHVITSVTDASEGPDLLHCKNNPTPVHFSWTIPAHAMDSKVVVANPRGEELFTWTKSFPLLDEFTFWKRAQVKRFEGRDIEFSLPEVLPGDGGHYICREGSLAGPVIPDCGQTLHYVDIPTPSCTQWGLPVAGQPGVLLCLARLPQHWDALGLKFHYDWYKDGQHVHTQEHHEWVLSPVQESDQGLYSCRVTETSRNCAPSAQSLTHSFNVVVPPRVRVQGQGEGSVLKVPEGEMLDLTCVVESAFPSVPPNGFSWTFSPSDSSPAQQLQETGDTLVLGPLTREDSGQYTCQARNDQRYRGRIPPGNHSVSLTITSDAKQPAVEGGDVTRLHPGPADLERLPLTPGVEVKEGEANSDTLQRSASTAASGMPRDAGVQGVSSSSSVVMLMAGLAGLLLCLL